VCEFGTPAISVIDVEKAELIGRIDLADLPNAVAVAPDMSSVYVRTTNFALSDCPLCPQTSHRSGVPPGQDALVTLRVNLRTT